MTKTVAQEFKQIEAELIDLKQKHPISQANIGPWTVIAATMSAMSKEMLTEIEKMAVQN